MEIYDPIYVGDVVEMRKTHPCGGSQWRVDRVGADIGMVCLTCKRRVLLPRRKFTHQMKRFLQRGAVGQDGPGQ
ncbi:MAG: DUF951 family protein [Caldilineaceae bacterium]|nr:DUF951 family protein [Caldilineaceae bacterium]